MRRVLIFLTVLAAALAAAPAARANFWEDGYKNFFADRPKVGHARWIQLQKQGWQYLQRHARSGNPEAMFSLGQVYAYSASQFMTGYHDDARVAYPDGRLIEKTDKKTNNAEGCRWYLKAAAKAHLNAMRMAGFCYQNGHGVPKDYDKARVWYQRAAEKGNYDASLNLGVLYRDHIGDYKKAREWLQYGIDHGFKYGLYELGRLWEQGKGGPKDLAKARQLYERATYPYAAKYYLGLMYEEGRGVPKDEAKALALYKKATSDDEVGSLAKSRVHAIENKEAATKKVAEAARRAEEQRKKEAAKKVAQERARLAKLEAKRRKQAADRAEQARVAKLTAGLRPANEFRKVAVANAKIRALPERKAKAGRKLQLGEQVNVIATLPTGWVRLAEEGAPVGWLHQSALEAVAGRPAPVATAPRPAPQPKSSGKPALQPIDAPYVALKNANVRAGPDVRSALVAALKAGAAVTALGKVEGKDWYLVAREGKRLGYVFGRLLEPAATAPPRRDTSVVAEIDFGRYHALVIGNNEYRNVASLQTAVADARAVAGLLRATYGFEVTLLENATRAQILRGLTIFRRTMTPDDNLLVYYAGHGWLDPDTDRGYWLPVDADRDDPTNWVSNASITDAVRAIRAKHVMVVADSCYSGTLTRGVNLSIRTPDHIARLSGKVARTVLTSGGLEPVADSGSGGNSVFAGAVLAALRENSGVLDGHTLFTKIRRPVMVNSDQTPDYGDIRKAGHAGGDFLFVRRN